jgi:hypothetical protein
VDDLNFSDVSEPFAFSPNALQVEIRSNIFFSNCIFLGKVTSNGKKDRLIVKSKFNNNLVFLNCDFRGEVDFSEMVVQGLLNFTKSTFREDTNFNGITVWAKDAYFSEITAEKQFSMIYALFINNLYILSATFKDNASFQQTTVSGDISFNSATFNKRAEFDIMRICGKALFNYVTFEQKALFAGTEFLHTVGFIKTEFKKDANFEKTYFLNKISFENNDSIKANILKNATVVIKY